MIKKIIIYSIITINIIGSFFVLGINVKIPSDNNLSNTDINIEESQIDGAQEHIYGYIKIVNKYLRFAIGAVCLGVLIYGGIRLMAANGDQEQMKKINKLLLGAVIGILISVFSYSIIRLIVNLF